MFIYNNSIPPTDSILTACYKQERKIIHIKSHYCFNPLNSNRQSSKNDSILAIISENMHLTLAGHFPGYN